MHSGSTKCMSEISIKKYCLLRLPSHVHTSLDPHVFYQLQDLGLKNLSSIPCSCIIETQAAASCSSHATKMYLCAIPSRNLKCGLSKQSC